MTHEPNAEHPRYLLEVNIPGLLYVRVERLPHWLIILIATAFPAVSAWLLTR
jgi:hypothetical protein